MFYQKMPNQKDIALAKNGLVKIKKIIAKKIYDLVILDEINIALNVGLLALKDILCLIKKIPRKTEVILTGRYAHPKIIKIADLVSEVKERKHYYKKGVKARRGIEF